MLILLNLPTKKSRIAYFLVFEADWSCQAFIPKIHFDFLAFFKLFIINSVDYSSDIDSSNDLL